ncbi:hypothetical protein IV203_018663 [Nitzschia inconspicua]|uniref:Uncharacterized protein n=1 Tax=Nitzschia inconspicua TaxID=303405 RepID=A0A9K3Q6R5_9STRA|nr:hypothetical protein IV203_018663 [Nitzschia inconspicua]
MNEISTLSTTTQNGKETIAYRRRCVTTTTTGSSNHRIVRRRQRQGSTPITTTVTRESHPTDTVTDIPFQVPISIPTDWLIHTSVVILMKHLLYARGLFPMTVDQLLLDAEVEDTTTTTIKTTNSSHNLAQRSWSSSNSSSLRRSMRKAREQVQRLTTEWNSWHKMMISNGESCNGHEQQLAFVLISIGPSYTQSRELYVMDVQGLVGDVRTEAIMDGRVEGTLTRRLLGTLLNHDKSPLQDLPGQNSPSYRMWISFGIQSLSIRTECGSMPSSMSLHQMDENCCPSKSSSIDGCNKRNLFATLIGRRSFPIRAASQKSGCVCIRLNRPPNNRSSNGNDSASTGQTEDEPLHPSSDSIAWFSLPTSIKGFRQT